MKGFLIGLTVFAGFVYGMLQINEYYDDRGACSWSLFSGGHYYHKERLDNVIKGLMKEIIERDKYARRVLLKNQGRNETDINQIIKALEPKYNREREKMAKYCYLDFEKKPYFQKKSMEVKPSDYCEIGNVNNGGNGWLFKYTSFNVKYSFDDESMKFFNEMKYITKLMRPAMGVKEKPNTWYPYTFYGMTFGAGFSPCKTRYFGGENAGWLQKYETEIHTYDKTKQVIAY